MTGIPRASLSERLRRIALAAVCVPPAVVLHELGHWIGNTLAGLPDATIHHASTGFRNQPAFWSALRAGDFALAESMGSVIGAGFGALLGIAVSWALMIAGARLVRRRSLGLVAAAVVMASSVRFVPVGILFVRGAAEHTDEAHVAQAVSAPWLLPALVLFGIAVAGICIRATHRSLYAPNRGRLMRELVIGVACGTVVWLGLLGPVLLP